MQRKRKSTVLQQKRKTITEEILLKIQQQKLQQEQEIQRKKADSFLKKEEFNLNFVSQNGIIKGKLVINPTNIQFTVDSSDFKRLQKDLLKQKKNKKYENNNLQNYNVSIHLSDIFDVNLINSSNINSSLDFLLHRTDLLSDPIKDDYGNFYLIKCTFQQIENSKQTANSQYIQEKIKFLIDHNKTNPQFEDKKTSIMHYELINTNAIQSDLLNQDEYIIYPKMPESQIINNQQFQFITKHLPSHLRMNNWTLVYTPLKHGFSYEQFLKRVQHIGIHVLVLQDSRHLVPFGAFLTEGWVKRKTCYGTGESFIFTFQNNENKIYYPVNSATHIQFCDDGGMSIGMDQDVALFINSSFAKGNTHETEMFKNGLLLPENDFNLQCIEVWGLEENALELSNLNFNNNQRM